jgi:hypothetical protein
MASIESVTFDQPSYAPGAPVTVTVDYTPDQPGTQPATHTVTATVTDASGVVQAQAEAPFTVNVPVAGGDVVAVTDDASDTYVQVSDSGSVAVFTTTAPSA